MAERSTIQKDIFISGIGIHSGEKVELLLKSSSSGDIILRRKDLNNLEIRIDSQKIKSKRGSFLDAKEGKILTLEHLLAVLNMFGIDSLVIEITGGEIPILDGSAFPFVQAVERAGVKPLRQKKKMIKILKEHIIQEKDAYVSFYPDSIFKVTYAIEYDHPAIKRQELSLPINLKSFIKEIAPARTFGFLKDVPHLRRDGLALGGSWENAIILDEEAVINGPLRYHDEFVRHKILDLIGDLFLLGHPVLGHFKAYKAGHSLHQRIVHFLLDNPEFWKYA